MFSDSEMFGNTFIPLSSWKARGLSQFNGGESCKGSSAVVHSGVLTPVQERGWNLPTGSSSAVFSHQSEGLPLEVGLINSHALGRSLYQRRRSSWQPCACMHGSMH